jgi:hypothetical protein
MCEASSVHEGRPLSEKDLADAADPCRAFKQEPVTTEEWQAIERSAQKYQLQEWAVALITVAFGSAPLPGTSC